MKLRKKMKVIKGGRKKERTEKRRDGRMKGRMDRRRKGKVDFERLEEQTQTTVYKPLTFWNQILTLPQKPRVYL